MYAMSSFRLSSCAIQGENEQVHLEYRTRRQCYITSANEKCIFIVLYQNVCCDADARYQCKCSCNVTFPVALKSHQLDFRNNYDICRNSTYNLVCWSVFQRINDTQQNWFLLALFYYVCKKFVISSFRPFSYFNIHFHSTSSNFTPRMRAEANSSLRARGHIG